jgi:ABC-2 type transport system ATP-binding protein
MTLARPTSIVSLREVTHRFGATTALDHLSLNIPSGGIFGLIGPDGAGKTTTLRLTIGALIASAGDITTLGSPMHLDPEPARRHLGYMPQRFALYGDLTVEENMRFFADLHGIHGDSYRQRRKELLAFSRLGDHTSKRAHSLSGGMQKKLALSCNLFHRPSLLVLDEPTNGVDPLSRRELWNLLYQLLDEGSTIIVSTPYLDEAERCTRVAMLHAGKLLAEGTPDELAALSPEKSKASFPAAFEHLIKRASASEARA